MSEMLNMLQNAVAGRSPIVYVFSPEEERILRGIREIAAQNGTPVITWSCVRGLDGEDAATQSPVEAIKTIIAKDIHGMIVMCDLAPFLNDNKTLRAIREAYNDGRAKGDRTIFLVCAENIVPEAIKKEIHFLEVPTPDENEIVAIIKKTAAA